MNIKSFVKEMTINYETSQDNIFDLMMKICSDEEITVVPITPVKARKPQETHRCKTIKKAQKRIKLAKMLFPEYARNNPGEFNPHRWNRYSSHARIDHFDTRPYSIRPYTRQNKNWTKEFEKGDVWA